METPESYSARLVEDGIVSAAELKTSQKLDFALLLNTYHNEIGYKKSVPFKFFDGFIEEFIDHVMVNTPKSNQDMMEIFKEAFCESYVNEMDEYLEEASQDWRALNEQSWNRHYSDEYSPELHYDKY